MNKPYTKQKTLLAFAFGAVLGFISIVVPPFFIPGTEFVESPLFPMVATGIEKMSLWAIICLFLSGMFLGFIHPRHRWLLGISTMTLFPFLAIIEMLYNPYSHNLWPIEFIGYGLMTLPGIIGAYIGGAFRNYKEKLLLRNK